VASLTRIAVALAAVFLAGCNFGTDDPAETINDFTADVASGDVPKACEEIVPDAQVLFYPQPVVEDGIIVGYASGCTNPSKVVLGEDARKAASGTKVVSSETNGDGAEVVTETGAGQRLVFSLVRIDERWRIKAPAELLSDLDSTAKSAARRAQTAIESYGAAHDSYSGADAAALRDLEPSLSQDWLTTARGSGDTYEVGVTSASGTEYTIAREQDGTIVSSCDKPELGGCAAGGTWTELAA
jgi:hypothetical protein